MRPRLLAALLLCCFFILSPSFASAQVANGEVTLSVRVETVPQGALEEPWTATLTQVDGERSFELQGTGPLRQPVGAGSEWELCLEAAGWWAPCQVISADPEAAEPPATVHLLPSGRLAGEVLLQDRSLERPSSLRASFRPAVKSQPHAEMLEGVSRCPVEDDGTWSCVFPAGKLDLAVRADGFVTHHLWDVRVRPGDVREVSNLVLRPGGRLTGSLEVSDSSASPGSARITARRMQARGGDGTLARRMQIEEEAEVGGDGAFHFQGLAPGEYVVEASLPGYADARAFPIAVWEQSTTQMHQALVLQPPVDLELVVDPPRDWKDRPWRVRIHPVSSFSGGKDQEAVFVGAPGPAGLIRVENQAPGTYLVHVTDLEGQGFFYDPAWEVTAGEAPRAVAIDYVALEGEVTIGDDPVEGKVIFGGPRAAIRSEARSDGEGDFSTVLPREGRWFVDIQASSPRLATKAMVEVAADRSGEAFLRIDLPDTDLFGQVVDEAGRPVAEAEVTFSAGGQTQRQVTNRAGDFSFRGFPEGPVVISAKDRKGHSIRKSRTTMLSTREGAPVGPVRLEVRETVGITGRVLGATGPVPGTVVQASTREPRMAGFRDSARTDLHGHFSLQAHPGAELLQVVFSPPGHALATAIFPADAPIEWLASRDGGALVLHGRQPKEDDIHLALFVFQNGLPISHGTLFQWARTHGEIWRPTGDQITIPQMAPGRYRVCLGVRGQMTRASFETGDWTDALDRCVEGQLASGGELRLDLGGVTKDLE